MNKIKIQNRIEKFVKVRSRTKMFMKWGSIIFGILFSVGLTLTFASPNPLALSLGITDQNLEIVGLILIGTIIVTGTLTYILPKTIEIIKNSISELLTSWKDRHFKNVTKVIVDKNLLFKIYEEDAKALGNGRTEWNEFLYLYGINSEYVSCWIDIKNSKSIHGFYLITAINKSTTKNILSGQIRKANDIQKSGFCKSFSLAHGIYIHDILSVQKESSSYYTKGHIVALLLQNIINILSNNRKIQYIFARPVSRDGLRLVKRWGFVPILLEDISDSIWKFDLDEVPRQIFKY